MFDRRTKGLRKALIGTAIAGAVLTAGCATPTPYRPATGNGYYSDGYSDQQIETDRFRVSFQGNNVTSRETVERYLLFRAAQLTLENGGDYFELVNRDTERRSRTYATQDPFYGGYGGFGYGGFSPYWRYHRAGFGWSRFGYDPFWDRGGVDVHTVDRYQAVAEIITGQGPKPDDVHAFDARDVIDHLGPTVAPPRS